jgi:hypothetical protein
MIENNEYNEDYTEKFMVLCTQTQALQLKGMASPVTFNNYNNTILASNDNPWSPIWINSNTDCTDNDTFTHRGWYLIDNVEVNLSEWGSRVACTVEATKIANDINELLTMQYTPGRNDNTRLDISYDDTDRVYSLDEDFTTFDDTNVWNAQQDYAMTNPSIAAASNQLILSGSATSNGTWGQVFTQGQDYLEEKPWTINFDMEWIAQPTGYPHRMYFWISTNLSDGIMDLDSSIVIILSVEAGQVRYYAYKIDNNGVITVIIPSTVISSSVHILKWHIFYDTNGHINMYVDLGAGYVKQYSGWTILGYHNDLYYGYGFLNQSSASHNVRSNYCEIYDYVKLAPNNVIPMPYNANLYTGSSMFTRAGSDGNISCYYNPTEQLHFQTSATNLYKGSVKAWSTNVTGGSSTQIINTDHVIDPTKFSVDNTLTKLVTTADSVKFYAYSGGNWVELNEFTFPANILLIKALYLSPERAVIQIDDTRWTLERGRQFCRVEHPNTDLTYNNMGCVYHDSSTSTVGAAADVSMLTQSYALLWDKGSGSCASPNPDVVTRCMIIKANPTIIESDLIPEDDITGIGWFNNSLSVTDENHYTLIAREFYIQPRQSIAIKGI